MEAQTRKTGRWALFRRAMRGDEVDVTQVPLRQAVAVLAIPMVAEMCMESLFAITDIFWVASLGADAIAVVGITESLVVLLEAVGVGVGMAVTAMVSRRVGEGHLKDAANTAGQSLWVGLIIAGALGGLGAIYSRELLTLMGASAAVVEQGAGYTRIMMGGSLTLMYLFLLAAVFRGAGEPAIAMRALWLGNGLNIVLDPLLIFGVGPFPEMGVEGAAVATVIGRGTGAVYLMFKLFGGTPKLPMGGDAVRIRVDILKRMASISVGGVAQFLIGTASWIALMRIIAEYGSEAVAGYTLAIRIIIFCILPSWGLSNAAATMVGQNLGAKQPGRAERAVWMITRYNTYFLGVMAVLFIAAARPMVGWFTQDEEVIFYAVDCLRIMAMGYVFYGIGMIVVQAFNGAGDTRTPSYLNLACHWALQIPIALALAHTAGLGPRGVFIAIVIAETTLTVLAVWLFRRGRWKQMAV